MTKKSIAQVSVFFVLLISLSIWYVINGSGKTNGVPIDMIPADAALIIEVDNPGEVFDKVNDKNSVFQKLQQVNSIKVFNNNIILLDSLLADNPDYKNSLWNSRITIAVFQDSVVNAQLVVFSTIAKNPGISALKSFLELKLNRDYGILDIAGVDDGFKIVDAGTGITQYIAIIDGVFIYTTSSDLLFRIIDTYDKKLPQLSTSTSFQSIMKSGGSKVQARAFIQYSEFSKLIKPLVSDNNQVAINWLADVAQWSEVDILLKNKELILSGFTIADSSNNYLSAFSSQSPVKMRAVNVLPYNTNTLIWLGLPDFASYFYSTFPASRAKMISQNINYDINKLFCVIGDEVAFASSAETVGSFAGSSWMAVRMKNPDVAKNILSTIARNLGNTQAKKHKTYSIRRINRSDFVSTIFGDAFESINKNYYTFIGDYAVFANSENSLINLIGYFDTGKTLDLNDNFKIFSDNIASNSNLLIYVKPGDIVSRLNQYFDNFTSRQLELNEKVISSFQGLSFQLTGGSPLLFTNIYTNHAVGYHEENLSMWKVRLEDEIVSGPFLVSDHQTKSKNVIVFDKRNNMYLIGSDGKMLWDRKIDSQPIGEIFEIDFYKNRKIQYLFNTTDYIYLIDKKGKDVGSYPKKLHSKATNGVVVFDYLNKRDYRLMLAQSDKKIYNYSKAGKEVKGWALPKMQNIVIAPVERLVANSKDYIIITDIENDIKIVDRKGKRRIKLSGNLKKAKNSSYYVNRTNSKGIIITTNETGKLVYISSSGKLNYTDFGKFSSDHFFLYEDFDGDRSKDFIYIDGNKLSVFDRFKKVLFSYDFGSDITIKPSFFRLGSKQHVLGVVADQERTIYLFDKKGNIIISKGLVGETQFTVGNLQNDNKINLVSAAGNTLYNYRLR